MINNSKKTSSENISVSQSEAFLQSVQWGKFQKSVGRNVFCIENDLFAASIIEHTLPIVGKYFYCPRGPIFCHPELVSEFKRNNETNSEILKKIKDDMKQLIEFAQKNNVGWIRIEPENDEVLEIIKQNVDEKIVRAPHDMQPKEIFAIDISKPAEQLLAEMKSKTRYNIGLAKKKGVTIKSSNNASSEEKGRYTEEFIRLIGEMAARNGIKTHPENYFRKMIQSFSDKELQIYVAYYGEKVIAANLVLFNGNNAIYLHGASGNLHRNVMAPFLLQWQAILDAKKMGCNFYNLGGVQTPGAKHQKHSSLVGVTNFKLGFSSTTKPYEFPGSYDVIVNSRQYWIYRGLQRAKSFAVRIRK